MPKEDLIIVDDFYKNPDKIRDYALGLHYHDKIKQNYCGIQTQNLNMIHLQDKMLDLIGAEKLSSEEDWVFGAFRTAQENDRGLSYVHFDAADWSGLVYLTPNNSIKEGTLFFKHISTGEYGTTQERKRIRSWEEIRDEGMAKTGADTLDLSKWENYLTVEYKYNRLVLFRGRNYYHAPGKPFGNCSKTARLTQHFFFDVD